MCIIFILLRTLTDCWYSNACVFQLIRGRRDGEHWKPLDIYIFFLVKMFLTILLFQLCRTCNKRQQRNFFPVISSWSDTFRKMQKQPWHLLSFRNHLFYRILIYLKDLSAWMSILVMISSNYIKLRRCEFSLHSPSQINFHSESHKRKEFVNM